MAEVLSASCHRPLEVAPSPQKARMKPPELGPAKPPPVVADEPKPAAEVRTAAASEPAAAPAGHATIDNAPALPGDIEKVIVTLERQSKSAQEAYADEEKPNEELGARLDEFYDAATGLRRTWRRANGKGFSAFTNKLLRPSAQEANRHAVEVQAKELVHRGSQIDGLLEKISMGPVATGYWKEVRRNLKLLEGSFR